jgi:hypothetical protein
MGAGKAGHCTGLLAGRMEAPQAEKPSDEEKAAERIT